MPGFTLIYQKDGLDESIKKRTDRLVEVSFKIHYIIRTMDLIILFRDGNQYPYQVIKTGNYIILIEGKIYNIDAENDISFIRNIKTLTKTGDMSLFDYFHSLDGEFVIYTIDSHEKNIVVINDFLGRLPLYVWRQKQFILSRDIYVMDKITTGLLFDETSIYQYLRLGFPVGKRTLYHDIDRVGASSLLRIDESGIVLKEKPVETGLYESSGHEKEPERALYEIFKEAVKNRMAQQSKVVVSLSGGMGSRLVAGEIEKSGYHAEYAAYTTETPDFGKEVEVVKKIGKHYQRSPHIWDCKLWAPEFFDELAAAKGGLGDFGKAFELQFMKDISSRYQMMLTGYGMHDTLACLFPDIPLNKRQFAAYVMKKHGLSRIRSLDRFLLFDLKKQEKQLRQYLLNLPFKNHNLKYKYFLLAEQAAHLTFEEEDRDRSFIWSTSPFYHPEFYRLAQAIPGKSKKNFRLLSGFTRLIDPGLEEIPHAAWDFPLSDRQRLHKMIFRKRVSHYLQGFKQNNTAIPAVQDDLVDLVGVLMNKGYGGQLSMYASKYNLKRARQTTLFHLIALLKVSEMSWKSF